MREDAVIRTGIIPRTIKRLSKLTAAVEGVGAGAVAASAARCAEYARAFVPVDTGALQAGIHTVSGGKYAASAVASAPYAAMVEYGTSKMAPQPYMLPAAHAAADGFFANARAELQRAAKEI